MATRTKRTASEERAPAGTRASGAADARFLGFGKLGFFAELAKHQSRDWFLAHKSEYDEGFARPMAALLAEVSKKLDRAYPDCELTPPKVFRLNRDVRFSADKSPYKTHTSGVVAIRRGSSKVTETPAALYLQLGVDAATGKAVEQRMGGAGLYMMDAEQLARFRGALLDDTRGAELAKLVSGLERRGFAMEAGETLKKAPRGVDPNHPRVELLKRKGLVAMFPEMPAGLHESRELVGWLYEQGKLAAPLVRWLTFAVG